MKHSTHLLLIMLALAYCFGTSACTPIGKKGRVSTENMIELSIHPEVSIVRYHAGPQIDLPAHSITICKRKSLLGALQKFYPDYWFSELKTLPSGFFKITITPSDGLILNHDQQSQRLRDAYEQSFGLKIELDDIDHIGTIH